VSRKFIEESMTLNLLNLHDLIELLFNGMPYADKKIEGQDLYAIIQIEYRKGMM